MTYIFIKKHYHGFNKQYIFILRAFIFYLLLYFYIGEVVHYDRRIYIIAKNKKGHFHTNHVIHNASRLNISDGPS